MHPNPIFRKTDVQKSLDFANAVSFGTLCLSTDAAPLISHIPFQLSATGTTADLHLVRSNPITRRLQQGPLAATLVVMGPHGYISPDWYEIENQVPTWNYVSVHLIGTLTLLDQDCLPPILDALSDHFEAQLAPKPIWKMAKVEKESIEKMFRQIVPCKFDISDVQSTWKLGQNKPDAARHHAADRLETSALGAEAKQIAKLMRDAK